MNKKEIVSYVFPTIEAVMTAIQENAAYQVVCMILTILSFILSIAYTIFAWYKKANEDGKITTDELADLGKQLGDKVDEEKKKAENSTKEKK